MPRTRLIALCLAVISHAPAADHPADWKAELAPIDDTWRSVPQQLVFNNTTEPQTLDPQLMTGVPESRLASALFEGLVGLHPETLAPVPGLATHWDASDDGLTWTFHLRPGLTWSDGTALTATTVVDSWLRALDPATASKYANMLFPIAGAEAYHTGTGERAGVAAVASDAVTITITLHQPCPYLLSLVAFHTWFPVPLHAIEAHGPKWIHPGNLVASGAFTLTTWDARERIVLTKNPSYWDAEFVKLETITVLPLEDQQTALQLFEAGEIHWQPAVPAARAAELKHNPDYYADAYLGTYYYRFNVTRPPLDNVHVRRALSLAIDRRAVAEEVLGAGQKPATAFSPPGIGAPAFNPPAGLGFDPEAAKAELEAAKASGADLSQPLELLYNTSESHRQVAEAIAAMWQRHLGIQVQLRNSEWKVYLEQMDDLQYDIARSAWIGDYNDPNTFLETMRGGDGNNRTGWANDTYDELWRAAGATSDPEERLAIFAQMETILVRDEVPLAPIYTYVNQGLLSEQVQGWYANLRDYHPWQYLYLE